jgi:hypothetical protein
MAAETPDKKIICIGHSKGSVDLSTAVLQHPEVGGRRETLPSPLFVGECDFLLVVVEYHFPLKKENAPPLHPQLIDLMYGHIAMQAPYNGVFASSRSGLGPAHAGALCRVVHD